MLRVVEVMVEVMVEGVVVVMVEVMVEGVVVVMVEVMVEGVVVVMVVRASLLESHLPLSWKRQDSMGWTENVMAPLRMAATRSVQPATCPGCMRHLTTQGQWVA